MALFAENVQHLLLSSVSLGEKTALEVDKDILSDPSVDDTLVLHDAGNLLPSIKLSVLSVKNISEGANTRKFIRVSEA